MDCNRPVQVFDLAGPRSRSVQRRRPAAGACPKPGRPRGIGPSCSVCGLLSFPVLLHEVDRAAWVEPILVGAGGVLLLGSLIFLWTIGLRRQVRARTAELERKNRELGAKEADLRSVLETAQDYLLSVDRDWRIRYINRPAPGFRLEDVIGACAEDFIDPSYRETLREAFERVWSTAERAEVEVSTTGEDDRPARYLVRVGPVRESGRVISLTLSASDITQRRLAEERLQQARRLETLGTMAGSVAHDFGNILLGIRVFAEMARDSAPPGSVLACHIQEVLDGIARGTELTDQILGFSRSSEKRRRCIRLRRVVDEVGRLLRPVLGTSIEWSTRYLTDADTVLADSHQLHQVVVNLCFNAAQAIGDGVPGRIEVALERLRAEAPVVGYPASVGPGDYVTLSVSDDGEGIAAGEGQRIFEPFVTTKERGKGTGLGLAIASGIVEDHGGTIVVESRPGIGSTFRVCLPFVPESNEVPASEGSVAGRGE